MMMKLRSTAVIAAALAVSGLAGCGGGGDNEAGAPTALSVLPSTLTLTAPTAANGGPPAGTCVESYAGDFYIYGGAAPYRLDNSAPDAVLLSKSSVDSPGGSFSAGFINGVCVAPATVVILDRLNNRVVLTLNNKPAGATTAGP